MELGNECDAAEVRKGIVVLVSVAEERAGSFEDDSLEAGEKNEMINAT